MNKNIKEVCHLLQMSDEMTDYLERLEQIIKLLKEQEGIVFGSEKDKSLLDLLLGYTDDEFFSVKERIIFGAGTFTRDLSEFFKDNNLELEFR